ncbi:MAG: M57 family metalloprotease [Myxococcota bacterium]
MTKCPVFISMCLLATIACEPDSEEIMDSSRDETEEILEHLAAVGFSDDYVDVDDNGHVFVGGDIHVTLSAAREMAPQASDDGEGFRQYRSTNLVDDDVICVDASVYTNNDRLDAIDGAIHRFNGQALDFEIRRVSGSEPDCDTVITVNEINGTGGSAGFPSDGHAYDTINMGDDVWSEFGQVRFRHLFMHELGHTIGFRHTDYYNRSISCGKGCNEGAGTMGVHHIPGTPTTATSNGSVMNACYSMNSDGEWSNNDVTAITHLYGVSFCDAFDGREISLKTRDDRFVRARDASNNWRLDARDGKNDDTSFTVECTNDMVWLRTSHGRYASPQGSGDSYIIRQRSGWNSQDFFEPIHYQNGRWEFATRYNRLMRARNGSDNWKIRQSSASQSDTRFRVHLEN